MQTQPLPMPASGRLMLGINDNDFNDNSGAFTVTVSAADRMGAPRQTGRNRQDRNRVGDPSNAVVRPAVAGTGARVKPTCAEWGAAQSPAVMASVMWSIRIVAESDRTATTTASPATVRLTAPSF